MGIDIGKMKKFKQEKSGAGAGLTLDEGDTLLYLLTNQSGMTEHESTMGFPFLDIQVHFGLGPTGKQMCACLNPQQQVLLKHPAMARAIQELGINVKGGCPVCEALEGNRETPGLWQSDKTRAMEIRKQDRYIWKVVAVKHRKDAAEDWKESAPDQVKPYECGKTINDGLIDIFQDNGDISALDKDQPGDPDPRPMTVKISRKGKDITTKYNIALGANYVPTKPQRAMILKAGEWEHETNMFRYAAKMFISRPDMEALLSGVATEQVVAGAETGGKNPCFGMVDMFRDGDPDCEKCAEKAACKAECAKSADATPASGKSAAQPAPQAHAPAAQEAPQAASSDEDGDDDEIKKMEQALAARKAAKGTRTKA